MPYAPPEMFDTNRKFNQKSDIFSFGMIAYEFFFDVLPVDFRKHTIPNLVEAYQTKKVILKSNKKDIEN
jgi:serine/threonine protein kinase